jgi:hypothetical protein
MVHPELAGLKGSAQQRRQPLIDRMQQLAHSRVGCESCSGICCTFVANSMQITPVEALDIYFSLIDSGHIHADLDQRLQTCIERYGLDRAPLSDGRRQFSRRTYTCPFFNHGALGCSLPVVAKPYGCLGFNAQRSGVADGEACSSDQTLLADRETDLEKELNRQIKISLDLGWDKQPIPVALRQIIARMADGQRLKSVVRDSVLDQ